MTDENSNSQKAAVIKKLLSEYLGVEEEDINIDDSLRDDLHMSSSDLSDFAQVLSNHSFEINLSELAEIETLEELFDKIIQEEI
jgi:acyl carrier protein